MIYDIYLHTTTPRGPSYWNYEPTLLILRVPAFSENENLVAFHVVCDWGRLEAKGRVCERISATNHSISSQPIRPIRLKYVEMAFEKKNLIL